MINKHFERLEVFHIGWGALKAQSARSADYIVADASGSLVNRPPS